MIWFLLAAVVAYVAVAGWMLRTLYAQRAESHALWRIVAWIVSRQPVADYIIGRATRTPYFHLAGYMNRYWLFNRYSEIGSMDLVTPRFHCLPSIRVHHILRKDNAEHMHDHPWNARTIILRNLYTERRDNGWFQRDKGHTAPVRFGEYHHIEHVHPQGAWTLFITWQYVGKWGFLVDGVKVPYDEYLEQHPERSS